MKKVIIDRKTWKRGRKGVGNPALENKEGFKCCLGFLGKACGVENLRDRLMPSSTITLEKWPQELFAYSRRGNRNRTLEHHLAQINDDTHRSYAEREAIIKREFEKMGYETEFVG